MDDDTAGQSGTSLQRWRPSILVAIAVLVTGCAGDAGSGGSTSPGSQARLDESTLGVARLLEVLEKAYPEDDGSTDAVVDAFSKALVEEEIVEGVRQVDGWQLGGELPCGDDADPAVGVIATGPEGAFFIGTASASFVAGFAEDREGDLGVVVARCVEGHSDQLHVAELPQQEGVPLRVAIESFADDGEPAARAAAALQRASEQGEPPDVELRQHDWNLGRPIRCPDAVGDPVAVGSGDGADAFAGFGTREVVVVRVRHLGEEIGAYAASCEGGAARELRQLARPLEAALEDR